MALEDAARFAEMVRAVGVLGRAHHLTVPAYRGVPGGPYDADHRRVDFRWVTRITVDHQRPDAEVMVDVLRGLVDANSCPTCHRPLRPADRLCDAGCVDDLDLGPIPPRVTSRNRFGGRNR